MEQAKAEMERRGIRPIAENRCGRWKEAVFCAEDMYGVRWVLCEYEGPNTFYAQMQT